MLDKRKYPAKFYLFSGLGSGLIIGAALGSTYILWTHGFGEDIFTSHFETSLLFTDAISQAGTATPLALISINWLFCRMGVKRWRHQMKQWFS